MGGWEKGEEERGEDGGGGWEMGGWEKGGGRERRREKKVHKRSLRMELQIELTHTYADTTSYPSFCQLAHTVLGVAGIWQTGQKTSRPSPTSLNHLKNKQKKHFLTKTGNISEYVDPHGLAGS